MQAILTILAQRVEPCARWWGVEGREKRGGRGGWSSIESWRVCSACVVRSSSCDEADRFTTTVGSFVIGVRGVGVLNKGAAQRSFSRLPERAFAAWFLFFR